MTLPSADHSSTLIGDSPNSTAASTASCALSLKLQLGAPLSSPAGRNSPLIVAWLCPHLIVDGLISNTPFLSHSAGADCLRRSAWRSADPRGRDVALLKLEIRFAGAEAAGGRNLDTGLAGDRQVERLQRRGGGKFSASPEGTRCWIRAVMLRLLRKGRCSVRNSSCQLPLLEARSAWPTRMLRSFLC